MKSETFINYNINLNPNQNSTSSTFISLSNLSLSLSLFLFPTNSFRPFNFFSSPLCDLQHIYPLFIASRNRWDVFLHSLSLSTHSTLSLSLYSLFFHWFTQPVNLIRHLLTQFFLTFQYFSYHSLSLSISVIVQQNLLRSRSFTTGIILSKDCLKKFEEISLLSMMVNFWWIKSREYHFFFPWFWYWANGTENWGREKEEGNRREREREREKKW